MASSGIPTTTGIASIPQSENGVDVSIIDTKAFLDGIGCSLMLKPDRIGQHSHLSCVCYSFLVHHKPTDARLLFDLGIRTDWETGYPPAMHKNIQRFNDLGWNISVPTDVAEMLKENNVPLESIKSIIWSHHHWDHTGDVSTFPHSTSIIVGPGFKSEFMPAYPERQDSVIDGKHVAGREMIELDFKKPDATRIGAYAAIDYFGDGSFYFLDTPGHTVGHISALARTTAGQESTFIFMGGDIVHHPGEFRPSQELPLPESIVPDPRQPPFHSTSSESFCPGSLLTPLHPASATKEADPHVTPFYRTGGAHDEQLAQATVDVMPKLDGSPNVLTIFAHDSTLQGVLGFFPETANDWKKKGWREQGLWRFLGDFLGTNKYQM